MSVMGEVSGSKPDAVEEKKRKKKCVRRLRNKKKKREEWSWGKENRQKDSGLARASTQSIPLLFIQSVVIINVYIQYLRELLLSSKTIERIHN